MIAAAAIAGLLALLRTWPILLGLACVVFLLNLIPLGMAGLNEAFAVATGLPVPRPAGIVAGLKGFGILAAGWVWCLASLAILPRPGTPTSAQWIEFWGWQLPMAGTGLGLVAFIARLLMICIRRRRPDLGVLMVTYTFAMAMAWLVTFLSLAPRD
jgi:hypothetical protein